MDSSDEPIDQDEALQELGAASKETKGWVNGPLIEPSAVPWRQIVRG